MPLNIIVNVLYAITLYLFKTVWTIALSLNDRSKIHKAMNTCHSYVLVNCHSETLNIHTHTSLDWEKGDQVFIVILICVQDLGVCLSSLFTTNTLG